MLSDTCKPFMLSATYKPFMLSATYKPFILSATYKPFMLSVIMLNVIMLHAVYRYAECCGTALTQTAWHCVFTRNFSIFFKIAFVGIIACVNTPLAALFNFDVYVAAKDTFSNPKTSNQRPIP